MTGGSSAGDAWRVVVGGRERRGRGVGGVSPPSTPHCVVSKFIVKFLQIQTPSGVTCRLPIVKGLHRREEEASAGGRIN